MKYNKIDQIFFTTVIMVSLFGLIFSICMINRNNEVYDLRTKMLDEAYESPTGYLYNKLMNQYYSKTYEEMLYSSKTIPELEEEWDKFVEGILRELLESIKIEACLEDYGIYPTDDASFSEEGKAELKEIIKEGFIEEEALDCFEVNQ